MVVVLGISFKIFYNCLKEYVVEGLLLVDLLFYCGEWVMFGFGLLIVFECFYRILMKGNVMGYVDFYD